MTVDWASAVATLPEGLALLDGDRRLRAANPAFARLLALDDTALGKTLRELLEPLAGPSGASALSEALVGDAARHDLELAGRTLRMSLARASSAQGYTCLVQDVTDEASTRRQLEKAEARFRILSGADILGVVVSRADGGFSHVNDAFLSMLGFTREDLAAGLVRWDRLTPPEFEALDRAVTERLLADGVAPTMEKEFFHKEGHRVPVMVFGGIVTDAERTEAVALALDMTEHKRLERELAGRARELEDDARRMDEFLAMLAHELRNPLAAISTTVQLQKRADTGTLPVNRLAVLDRQTRNLTRIVDDLLDVSRIAHGKIELRPRRMDAVEVVRGCVENLSGRFERRGVSLAVDLPGAPVWLDADPTRLEQIVANLLENAAKYTDAGGHVSVSLAAQGREVVLDVRDDGIGIDAAMLRNVFTPFVQVHQVDGRSGGGLGIGLALVRSLVTLHGGSVVADSAGLGRGSRFTVRLPRAADFTFSTDGADAAEVPPSRPRDVLVVEDNTDARTALAELLKSWGHAVRVAEDGPTALALARDRMPEVALLDIGLEGMDGNEVARALRALDGGASVLIAALTGYGLPADRQRSAQAGVDRHFVKPVDVADLARLLHATRSHD